MLNKILTLTAAVIVIGLPIGSCYGDLVVYESFSQTPGDLDGQAGGTGLNSWNATTGTNAVSVVNPPTLTYGDLDNAGGQANVPSSASTSAWVTTTSALADNNLLDDGATLWFSYMFEKASGGGSNEWAGFAFGTDNLAAAFNGVNMTNGGNGVGVATRNDAVNVATWLGGGNAAQGSGLSITYGESALVVGKIEWGGTVGDDETITIYTPSTTDLGTIGPGVSKTVTGFDQTLLDTISFTQRNSGGTQIYDEIRFGDTYAAVTPFTVVPEPSSLSLLGLTGLMMIHRRRRS